MKTVLCECLEHELAKECPDVFILRQLGQDIGLRDLPAPLRASLWKELLGIRGKATHFQLTQSIIHVKHDMTNQRVIEADVLRTRSSHPFFQSSTTQSSLAYILTYYCKCHNIQYKQGMNEILASLMLVHADAASASGTSIDLGLVYQCLHAWIDTFLPHMFRDSEFWGLQVSLRLLRQLVLYHDPELCLFLDEHGLVPELYATPWLLTTFARKSKPEVVYYCWDFLLLQDQDAASSLIVYLACSVLLAHRHEILHCPDVAMLPQVLTGLHIASVDEMATLCTHTLALVRDTPKSFHHDVRRVTNDKIDRATFDKMEKSLACVHVCPSQVLHHIIDQRRDHVILVDCRAPAQVQAQHLSSGGLPSVVVTYLDLVTNNSPEVDLRECFPHGRDFCLVMASGPEEDHEQSLAFETFVRTTRLRRVSIVTGGMSALVSVLLRDYPDSILNGPLRLNGLLTSPRLSEKALELAANVYARMNNRRVTGSSIDDMEESQDERPLDPADEDWIHIHGASTESKSAPVATGTFYYRVKHPTTLAYISPELDTLADIDLPCGTILQSRERRRRRSAADDHQSISVRHDKQDGNRCWIDERTLERLRPSSSCLTGRVVFTPTPPAIHVLTSTSVLVTWRIPLLLLDIDLRDQEIELQLAKATWTSSWTSVPCIEDRTVSHVMLTGLTPASSYVVRMRVGYRVRDNTEVEWGPYSSTSCPSQTLEEHDEIRQHERLKEIRPGTEEPQDRIRSRSFSFFLQQVKVLIKSNSLPFLVSGTTTTEEKTGRTEKETKIGVKTQDDTP